MAYVSSVPCEGGQAGRQAGGREGPIGISMVWYGMVWYGIASHC